MCGSSLITLSNSLILRLLFDYLGFSSDHNIICKWGQDFLPPHPMFTPYFHLAGLARTSSSEPKRSRDSRSPCIVPDLSGPVPYFSPLRTVFLAFPMPWPFNTVLHVVVTPTIKLLHNCNLATLMNHNVYIWYSGYVIYDHCGDHTHRLRTADYELCQLTVSKLADGLCDSEEGSLHLWV